MRLRRLLLPFSWLYALATTIRNRRFDSGKLPSQSYPLPIISVGNITVGGTGKTPLTEHLIRLLQSAYQVALLSRGYGRKTKGVKIADEKADYATIGDEPMQLKQKFPHLTVVVAEKRRDGIATLLNHHTPPQIILMDDAFQHRYVKPGLSILVMDYHRPIWKDICLPAGNLREPASGMKRADHIVVSKCPPDLSVQAADNIKKKLNIQPQQQIFFTTIRYGEPQKLIKGKHKNSFSQLLSQTTNPITLLAGIGNPVPFFRMAEKYGKPINKIQFADHHDFTKQELHDIEKKISHLNQPKGLILTTEKDAVRLSASPYLSPQLADCIWYIPIKPTFLLNGEQQFNEMILQFVEQY
ncbi:tetraacyldisaccharide 4'-kinase [Geofilum sp. OHC36d9]|uniref:tetraacyldisaccharide 4'-kinase n=1 Tax=Geofilum sp. OHC36d9 TaxID=3458413 RepID=UPI0040344873